VPAEIRPTPVAFHVAGPSYERRSIFTFSTSYTSIRIEKPDDKKLWLEEGFEALKLMKNEKTYCTRIEQIQKMR